MADTTNYGWTKPTEGGSTGAWDTILNTALDDIDANLKTAEDKAVAALLENLTFPILDAAVCGVISTDAFSSARQGMGGGVELLGASGSIEVYFPLLGLNSEMNITGFRSRGIAPAGTTLSVSLYSIDEAGSTTTLGTHSHSSALATLTKSGMAHSVVAGRQYVARAALLNNIADGADGAKIIWVQPTVTRD